MTVIVVSSANGVDENGSYAANGGTKFQELLVQMLQDAGYRAYIATYDGTRPEWMLRHTRPISLAAVEQMVISGEDVRCVTTWLGADAFLDLACSAGGFYYLDLELAWTLVFQNSLWARLPHIRACATNNRVHQGWYLSNGISCTFLREWSDTDLWQPDPSRRIPGRIGYMAEPPVSQTMTEIAFLRDFLASANVHAEFVQISGTEAQVLAAMQSCDVFLGMNRGKHPVFGEGCPRSQQEAMLAGAVLIAYDVHGNREYCIDGYNGFLVPVGGSVEMAHRLKEVLTDRQLKDTLRQRSILFSRSVMGPEGRLAAIEQILELRR